MSDKACGFPYYSATAVIPVEFEITVDISTNGEGLLMVRMHCSAKDNNQEVSADNNVDADDRLDLKWTRKPQLQNPSLFDSLIL
jgi:hypothetical protein